MHHLSFTSADTEAQGSQHRFDTDHTGEGIKDKFLELFHKWGLDKEEFLVDFDSTPIITIVGVSNRAMQLYSVQKSINLL